MVMGRPRDAEMLRDVVVCVRFTAEEIGYIDDVREGKTRSTYIRETMALETSGRRHA